MAPEILQLLLLLLSPGNSSNPGRTWAEHQPQEVMPRFPGSRGQDQGEEEHRQLEGETFSVNCNYKLQEHGNRWMNWCKKLENGEDCGVTTSETSSKLLLSDREYFSSNDKNSGILTIKIFELRRNDSGIYECVNREAESKKKEVLKRVHLMVLPIPTQSPGKGIQTTLEVTSNNQVTNSSPKRKLFIVGVVLCCLLLSVLLAVGILCARRIYQKAGKGDDSESQGEKLKGSAMKMDSDETAKEVHYATVSDRRPREPTNAEIHTPVENVEYATIKRNRC